MHLVNYAINNYTILRMFDELQISYNYETDILTLTVSSSKQETDNKVNIQTSINSVLQ